MAGEIIYGAKAVEEAIDANHPVNRLYLAKESHAKNAGRILDKAKKKSIPVDTVPQAKLNDLTHTRDHQGIAAAISPVVYTDLDTVLGETNSSATIIVLDQIQHPKNLGMIIRIAAGAGADAVILPKRGGALIDDSVVRASAGTVFRVPIVPVSNLGNTIRKLKDENFWIYGLDAKGKTSVMDMDWPKKNVLIVGNESTGLRSGIEKTCDELVSIPLENDVESLNAAVATGIALFQMKGRN